MKPAPRVPVPQAAEPMFEDFSQKAKAAVKAAQELAERLGDKSVATGHVIYGVAIDDSTCVHHVLKDLNVDPEMCVSYVHSLAREAEVFEVGQFNRHELTVC